MKSKPGFNGFELRHLLVILLGTFILAHSTLAAELPLNDIKLPPGFEISIYASNVPNARSLTLSPKGTLFVSQLRLSLLSRRRHSRSTVWQEALLQ